MNESPQFDLEVLPTAPFHWVGNGFPVRSVFGYNDYGRQLSPFLLFDYAAPYEFKPGSASDQRGVGSHPHRGFETVTIVYQGEIEHRDSHGGGGRIGPGDVQWMTAGSGLLHEEFHAPPFVQSGGTFEVIQLWINLPRKDKFAAPAYQTISRSVIPSVELGDGTCVVRVIAGNLNQALGAARTFTDLNVWDVVASRIGVIQIPLPVTHTTRALFVRRGAISLGGSQIGTEQLAIIRTITSTAEVQIHESDTQFLVLSGEPIDEAFVGHGPFVMNSESEIAQAFKDFRSGKFGILE